MFNAYIKLNQIQKKVQVNIIKTERITIKIILISINYKISSIKTKKNLK
jgi:hypothetical protein